MIPLFALYDQEPTENNSDFPAISGLLFSFSHVSDYQRGLPRLRAASLAWHISALSGSLDFGPGRGMMRKLSVGGHDREYLRGWKEVSVSGAGSAGAPMDSCPDRAGRLQVSALTAYQRESLQGGVDGSWERWGGGYPGLGRGLFFPIGVQALTQLAEEPFNLGREVCSGCRLLALGLLRVQLGIVIGFHLPDQVL